MKKVTTNKNQIRMDKIVNDMAVLFEEKITASSLAEWLALINQYDDNPKSIKELIWAFGFMLLPSFIKRNTKAQRIEFLKKDLTDILNEYTDMVFRESLGDIGIKFGTESKKGKSFPEEIQEFMQIYTTLLIICEMNDDYVFLENKLKGEIEKAA